MLDLSSTTYDWIKALHIMSVMAWMAGLFYLPRLFVYHANADVGSELSETLKVMERRLLRAIMNPAMIASYIFGTLLFLDLRGWEYGYMHVKLTCILGMTVVHHMLGRHRKAFLEDRNTKSHVYYRYLNEVPTVLMIILVIMVVVKPF